MSAFVRQQRRRRGFAVSPSDGTPIYFSVGSASARPDLVLCDGIGCDGYVWRRLRPELEDAHRVVHWHYRGHGRSAAPRDPARVAIADLADDLAAVLDEAEVAQAVVLGHSMGVQVALETARRHPDRVRGLVLICGAPSNPLRTFRGGIDALVPRLRRVVERAPWLANGLARALLPTRFAFHVATRVEIDGALVELADFMPYLRGLSRVDVRLFLAMLAAAGEHSAESFLPTIALPTLVIGGARDGFTPLDRSREMAHAIPGAEYLELEHGSHTAPLEAPVPIARAVSAFLARVASQIDL